MDDTYEKIPAKIKGLYTTLLEFQRTSVKALIDIENTKKIKIRNLQNNRDYMIETTAGVFSDAVGSGKTISMLALILMNKVPKSTSDILPLEAINRNQIVNYFLSGCIRRKYKKILKPTLIFAGRSVIEQWAIAIAQFTNLKYFKVIDVRYLRVLFEYIENGTVNDYDIILVKNGKVTSDIIIPFNLYKENKNNGQTPYIHNLLSNIRNVCWKRIIIDDYDTIGLPRSAGIINGLFTWYISSTTKAAKPKRNLTDQYYNIEEFLLHHDYPCSYVSNNYILFHIFNIRNSTDFIQKYNKLTNPKYYIAKYKNPNDTYVNLLGEIGNDKANEVVQMLNSGSIHTAAKSLDIESNNVSDIFEKILGNQYNLFKQSTEILEFIDLIPEDPHSRLPFKMNPDQDDTYSQRDLLAQRMPEYNYPNLKSVIKDTKEKFNTIKYETGKAIQRVKDNIGSGACPVCTDTLRDSDPTIIFKCCSMITCDVCGFLALDAIKAHKNLTGRCPKCRKIIKMTNLIAVGCDLDNIINFKFSDKEEETPKEESQEEEKVEEPKERTKIDGIIDIIQNRMPVEASEEKLHINQLQTGEPIYIAPPEGVRKVLIFASYDEAISNISKKIKDANIKFWTLAGTAQHISAIANEFNKCQTTCVLIINSTIHCSGLNLQTATDLIFSHVIQDENVNCQVAGRIQRIGRSCTARIWFMIYENEERWMERYRYPR